jgi:hypothetical protein
MDPFAKKMVSGALVFGSAMLLMAAALSVFYFHLYPRCSEQVMAEAASPDQQWIAAVMERRCGPESPFLLHVNLRPAGQPISLAYFSGLASDGEVLVVEEETAGIVPELEWNSSHELTIRCPRCSSSFAQKMDERLGAILIRYQAK